MITYAFITNKGSREINEDAVKIYSDNSKGCFVLADGLGGHDRGEVASGIVVEESVRLMAELPVSEQNLQHIFLSGQDKLMKAQRQAMAQSEMKTTMVTLWNDSEKIIWGHVGDSRLYYFHNNRLKEHTLDHSVPQMLVFAREIKDKDIRFHPDRNRLLKVMGTEWSKPECEIKAHIRREKKQAFLLCSDGFWELIDEKNMTKCLKASKNVQQWCDSMAEIVCENGKGKNADNFSAICVWMDK